MNSSDFYDIYKKNKEPLHDNLLFLFLVVVICLSALFPDLWVFRNFISVAIIGLVCSAVFFECYFGLFLVKDSLERIKQWSGYYESNEFEKGYYYYYPPLYDGNFVRLSNGEYYRVSVRKWHPKYDYLCRYRIVKCEISLYDDFGDNVYSYSMESNIVRSSLMRGLYEKVTADGLDIFVIYNKYGDVLWRRSDNAVGPFKYRVYIYRAVYVIAALICLFVSLTPFFLTDGMKLIGAIILSSFGAGG